MATVALAGCSGDSNELGPDASQPNSTGQEKELTIGLSASATSFVDATEAGEDQGGEQQAMRRSWTPPSGYFLYGDIYDGNGNLYVNYANSDLTNKSIEAFFTRASEDEPLSTDPTYYHGRLRYMSSTNKWRLSINKVDPDNIPGGDYYVYGFIPSDAADGATIDMLSEETSYTAGATLTIRGLRTAGYDACVIIGAREGFCTGVSPNFTYYDGGFTDGDGGNAGIYDPGIDTRIHRLTAGDFKFNLSKTNSNYLFLLFDHLCSAVTISIKVDDTYNTLRTIKLKQLTLQTATESGLMAEKADVVMDLKSNTSGLNPITNLNYEPTGDGAMVYHDDDGVALTNSFKSFLSHFMPISGVTKVVINSTYDVYDKKNNLVRKDCKATNTIRLSDIFLHFPGVERGWKYTINMTVKPTYLYVLSDPDLDNPTVVVN